MTLDYHIDENHIAHVTLSRAEVRNAFNAELIAALHERFLEIKSNRNIRAVVLSGAGKSFSAGADLAWMKEAATYSEQENFEDAMRLSNMLAAINDCPAPVIAVAHGAAMGGGVGLLACADIVIAAKGCKFALSEVKLGLTPATISPFVINAIGARWARRLFTTAEIFTTDLAEKIGLVHETYDDAAFAKTHALALAKQIASNAPDAVSDAKRLVLDFAGEAITDELRGDTARRIASRRASPEGREGLSAFLEKRSPQWPGDVK